MASPNYSFSGSISAAPEEGRWLPGRPLAPVGARLHPPVGTALPKWGEQEGGQTGCHPSSPGSDLDKGATPGKTRPRATTTFARGCACAGLRQGSQILLFLPPWSKSEDANHCMERSKALIARKVNIRTSTGEWRQGHGSWMKALKMDADMWSFCN